MTVQSIAEPVTFTFTPTRQDYISGMRYHIARRLSVRLILILFGLIFVGGVAMLPTVDWDFSIVLPQLLLFPVFAFMFLFWLPFSVGRQVERNERLTCETTWQVDDERLQVKTRFTDMAMDWGTFAKSEENKDYFLLIYTVNKNMIQIIPKRAFTTAEHEAAFRRLEQRHIRTGNNKKETSQ